MYLLKRAFLSVLRNSKRTVILFLIMVFSGVLVTGSLVIKQASINVRDAFLEKSGASVYVQYMLEDDLTDYRSWSSEDREQEETFEFYYDALKETAENKTVKEFKYSLYMFNYSDKLINMNGQDADSNVESDLVPRVLIYGVCSPSFLGLDTYDINIREGRNFTKKEIENGDNVCLINENVCVYDDNGNIRKIMVGEEIPVEIIVFNSTSGQLLNKKDKVLEKQEKLLRVIGTFHVNNEEQTGEMTYDKRIYVPNKTVESFYREYKAMEKRHDFYKGKMYEVIGAYGMGITDVVMQCNTYTDTWFLSEMLDEKLMILNHSPGNLETIMMNGKPEEVPKTVFYKAYKSNDAYMNVSWMLKSLDNFADIVFYVSVVAFTVVLSLVIILFLKNRKNEIGILMSLGEKKSNIICQTVGEILLIGIVSFVISTSVGYNLAKPISTSMIESSIIAERQSGTTDSEGNIINKIAGIDEEDIVDLYRIEINGNDVLKITGIELSVILISSLASVVYITRFKPRKVMLG